MDPREIKRIRRSILNGNKQFILFNIEMSKERVNADLLRLRECKEELTRQYFETRSVWTSGVVLPGVRPSALADQIRVATLALAGALAINLIEGMVAGWISSWGVVPILLAILLPISIKTVLITIWLNENQPQEMVRRIKIFVLSPSLIMFVLAAILLLMVRVLPDEVALKLETLFSVSILVLGIGCLAAAAGLFALAHIYCWSKSAERAFCRLEFEEINTRELLKNIESMEITVRTSIQLAQNSVSSANRYQSLTKSLALGLFALLVLSNAACATQHSPFAGSAGPQTKAAAAAAGQATSSEAPESDLRLFFDTTNSQSRNSYEFVIDSIVKQLPQIIEKNHALRLVIYIFAENGWEAHPLFDVALPELKRPQMAPSRYDELDLLRGRKNQVAENQAQERYRQMLDQATARYHEELGAVLSGISRNRLLAATDYQAHCTDLNGALVRIASLDATNRRQLVFLITDGTETCAHAVEPVAEPNGPLKLAIILTSEKAGKNAYLSFSDRRAQLQRVAPWAVIGAYHDEDFNSLLGKAPAPKTTELRPAIHSISGDGKNRGAMAGVIHTRNHG